MSRETTEHAPGSNWVAQRRTGARFLSNLLPSYVKRLLRYLPLVLLVSLLLAGCAFPTPVAEVTSPPPATAVSRPSSTPIPTFTPTRAPIATATPTFTPAPTATPTPTPTPTPLPGATLLAFETHRDGNGEIYLLDTATKQLTNLTRHPADDRAPAWRPDGRGIAFESHRDGNWEIYALDLVDGTLARLTNDRAYDGHPAWSPDGSQLAFETYRDGNLEIYMMAANGGRPRRLTDDPAGDYGPAWSPGGDSIAFTSWRDGNKEIYSIPSEGGGARNLTQNPADDEDPAWRPDGGALAFVSWRDVDAETGNRNAEIYQIDLTGGTEQRLTDNPWPDIDPVWDVEGRLVWAAYDPGAPFETYDPYRPGDHHLYRLDLVGEGEDNPERLTDASWDDRRPSGAPPQVVPVDGLASLLPPEVPPPTPPPSLPPGALVQVVEVPSILASFTEQPIRASELVSPSLTAWQQDLIEASGWDFLQMTLGAWRSLDQVRKREMYEYDYGYLSWHKAGRALDLPLEYKFEGIDQMRLIREDLGDNTYWRMYLRTASQDGSQGEPLKDNPWLYWWHIVPDAEPEAYDAGGKRLPIPAGYYLDVTAMAKRHGWERIAAYQIEGDYHWHTDSNGVEYWHYERTDELDWWQAMSQIYSPETLERSVGWDVAQGRAQSEEMIRGKGIPAP